MGSQVVLSLAVHNGCEHTHTSEREPYVPYVVGVSTPIRQTGNLTCRTSCVRSHQEAGWFSYMLYVVGVGSPIPFQEVESFSFTLYVVGLATPTLFLKLV